MLQTLRWSAGRVVSALITLLGVSILIFAAVRLMPGSYEDIILGPLASPEERVALAAAYGLDQPIIIQYFAWIGQIVSGDLGVSFVTQSPVVEELAKRIPVTALLTVMALLVTLLIGIPLGVWTGVRSGAKQGGAMGRLASGFGISVPEFVLGSVVIFVFSRLSLGIQVGGVDVDRDRRLLLLEHRKRVRSNLPGADPARPRTLGVLRRRRGPHHSRRGDGRARRTAHRCGGRPR